MSLPARILLGVVLSVAAVLPDVAQAETKLIFLYDISRSSGYLNGGEDAFVGELSEVLDNIDQAYTFGVIVIGNCACHCGCRAPSHSTLPCTPPTMIKSAPSAPADSNSVKIAREVRRDFLRQFYRGLEAWLRELKDGEANQTTDIRGALCEASWHFGPANERYLILLSDLHETHATGCGRFRDNLLRLQGINVIVFRSFQRGDMRIAVDDKDRADLDRTLRMAGARPSIEVASGLEVARLIDRQNSAIVH